MWRTAGRKTRVGTLIKGQLDVVHVHDEVVVTFITVFRFLTKKKGHYFFAKKSVVAVAEADADADADAVAVVWLWLVVFFFCWLWWWLLVVVVYCGGFCVMCRCVFASCCAVLCRLCLGCCRR